MDINTLRNLEKAIDKNFGSKEAHIYYSEDLSIGLSKINTLEKNELPRFSIIFPSDMSNKFIFYRADVSEFKFSKEYKPNDVISLMKLSIIQNPKYFPNNHISIYINNLEQLKYLSALKERFTKIKEYKDSDEHY